MARTTLPILSPATRSGVSIADAALTDAIADGHMFVNDGSIVLVIQNTNGASRTVTIPTPGTVDGLTIQDLAIVVPATTGRIITPTLPRTVYNQSTGEVYLDYSATAGLKIAAVRVPKELLL